MISDEVITETLNIPLRILSSENISEQPNLANHAEFDASHDSDSNSTVLYSMDDINEVSSDGLIIVDTTLHENTPGSEMLNNLIQNHPSPRLNFEDDISINDFVSANLNFEDDIAINDFECKSTGDPELTSSLPSVCSSTVDDMIKSVSDTLVENSSCLLMNPICDHAIELSELDSPADVIKEECIGQPTAFNSEASLDMVTDVKLCLPLKTLWDPATKTYDPDSPTEDSSVISASTNKSQSRALNQQILLDDSVDQKLCLPLKKRYNLTAEHNKSDSPAQGQRVMTLDENIDPSIAPDSRAFSPLPSTSKDTIIIDLNNTRFNEAIGFSSVRDSETSHGENCDEYVGTSNDYSTVNDLIIEPSCIIECSSCSENDNSPVIVSEEKNIKKLQKKHSPNLEPDVIDLLLDETETKNYDSDCEIVDVDLLIAQNNAILNKPKPDVITLPDTTISVTIDTQPTVDVSRDWTTLLKDFFDKQYNHSNEGNTNSTSTMGEMGPLFSTFSSFIELPSNFKNLKGSKRDRKKGNLPNNKKPRVLDIIDLDSVKTKEQTSSDVIVIDSDISMNSSSVDIDSTPNWSPFVCLQNNNPLRPRKTRKRSAPKTSSNIDLTVTVNASLQGRVSEVVIVDSSTGPCDTSTPCWPFPTAVPNIAATSPKNRECPVCLEAFKPGNVVSTFCGHIFCAACMNKVKATSKKCPTCRKALKGKGFHPIFL